MAQDVGGEGPDILGHDVGPAPQEGMRPGRLRQGDRCARRPAEGNQRLQVVQTDTARIAGGAHEVHDVVDDLLIHVEIGNGRARGENRGRLEHPLDRNLPAAAHAHQHFLFFVPVRIAHVHLEHEPIELGLRERVRPLAFDWILGGEDEKRLLERERGAADRHLLLLHCLQQRGLHLGGRPVHLVGQDDVGEQRPLPDVELLGLLIVDHRADQIGRQQVGCELDARERGVDDLRQCLDRQRLCEAGNALEQDVAAGQQTDEEPLHHYVLAHQSAGDFLHDPLHRRGIDGRRGGG